MSRTETPTLIFFAYFTAWALGGVALLLGLVLLLAIGQGEVAVGIVSFVFCLLIAAYHGAIIMTIRQRHPWARRLILGWWALYGLPTVLGALITQEFGGAVLTAALFGGLGWASWRHLKTPEVSEFFLE